MAKMTVVAALLVVLAIDLFLFLGQTAVTEIGSETVFMNMNESTLTQYGTDQVLNTSSAINELPSAEQITAGDESNIFTDAINVITSFFKNTIGAGFTYLTSIVGAPVNYLKLLNLPNAFVYAIGAFWYGLTLFLIVAFITGRE